MSRSGGAVLRKINRKIMDISVKQSCRVCLKEGSMISIFLEHHSFRISTKIESLAGIKIDPEDGLPGTICRKCLKKLESCLKFIQLCQDSNTKLRTLLNVPAQNVYTKYDETLSESDTTNDLQIDEDTQSTQTLIVNYGQEITSPVRNDQGSEGKSPRKAVKQQCFTCGKVMSSRFRLKTHLLTHTGERPFPCPHCAKRFSLAQNLKVHLRRHTGEKPLECVECGATFAHTAGLAAHRRKHSGLAPYPCSLCPRTFRTGGHLQYHMRRHTGEKKFECNTCNRAFITRSDLKQHSLSHTGDKPHVCCICGLRVTRATHLRRHIRVIHNGDKPLRCTQCDAKFTKKTDYEKHRLKHEENLSED